MKEDPMRTFRISALYAKRLFQNPIIFVMALVFFIVLWYKKTTKSSGFFKMLDFEKNTANYRRFLWVL
jgi:hypothetical protein